MDVAITQTPNTICLGGISLTKRSPEISLANAPVSYGAFEVTVGIDPVGI